MRPNKTSEYRSVPMHEDSLFCSWAESRKFHSEPRPYPESRETAFANTSYIPRCTDREDRDLSKDVASCQRAAHNKDTPLEALLILSAMRHQPQTVPKLLVLAYRYLSPI